VLQLDFIETKQTKDDQKYSESFKIWIDPGNLKLYLPDDDEFVSFTKIEANPAADEFKIIFFFFLQYDTHQYGTQFSYEFYKSEDIYSSLKILTLYNE
jgi:hypothetical protein